MWERAGKAQRSYLRSTEQPRHLKAAWGLKSTQLPAGEGCSHAPFSPHSCSRSLQQQVSRKKPHGFPTPAKWINQVQNNSNSSRRMDRRISHIDIRCSLGHTVQQATRHRKCIVSQCHIGCDFLFPVDNHTASHGFLSCRYLLATSSGSLFHLFPLGCGEYSLQLKQIFNFFTCSFL